MISPLLREISTPCVIDAERVPPIELSTELVLRQLARSEPWERVDERVALGTLESRELFSTVFVELEYESVPATLWVGSFHDRQHRFAHVVVRYADDSDIGNGRVADQTVLDLLWVDVDSAGDDHEGLAVGEKEVAVLIDVADVADGTGGASRIGRRPGARFAGSWMP